MGVAEMEPIQGWLKEADHVAAQWLHIRPRPIFAIIGIMLLGVALAALYASRSWSIGLALLFVSLILFVYMPFKARRQFREYKALSERTVIELRDDGIYIRRENGEGLVPWSHLIKWRSNDKLLLLYPTSQLFYPLPSHFFQSSESFHDFVALVKTRLGNPT